MSRYIDADKLSEKLDEFKKDVPSVVLAFTQGQINNAPTADVVEVRHGEWIDKPTGAYSRMQSWCSACGKHSGIGGIESNRHKPYCPNCGADMRGKRREEDEG